MSDFKVQFVEGTIASATASINVSAPAFEQVTDLAKSFIIPANPRQWAGTGRTTGGLNNSFASISAVAQLIDIDTVTFTDGEAAIARNNLCGVWLAEYIGPAGGVNEVIVRDVKVFNGTAATFDSTAIAGIVDINRCVPFATMMSAANNNDPRIHTGKVDIVNNGVNNVVRVSKVNAVQTLSLIVYVVEFVGTNWGVQKVAHTFAADNTNEDEVISAVVLANSFVYTTSRQTGTLLTNNLYYVWLQSTTNLRHRVLDNFVTTPLQTISWVISNPQMDVAVYGADPDGVSDLAAGGASPEERTVNITAVPELNAAFVLAHLGSDTVATTPAPAISALVNFTDADTVRIRRSDNSGGTEYKIQVIDLSAVIGLAVNSVATIVDGVNFNITGSFGVTTAVTLGGVSQVAVSADKTTIVRTGTLGTLRYGVLHDLVITTGGVITVPSISINPPATKNFINLGALTEVGQRLTATPDIAPGDQVEWSNVVGGTIADVEVFEDGSFSAIPAVTAFDFRVNDGTGWGTIATQTVGSQASDISNTIMRIVTDFTRLISFALTNIEYDT